MNDAPNSVSQVVVIGVGALERGDDAVGRVVARRLRERPTDAFSIADLRGEALELMDAWAGADAVVLVDAMPTVSSPGAIHRFDASSQPLPAETARASTHDMGVAHAIELARAMGSLPRRVIVFAVEGDGFGHTRKLSEGVESAIDTIVSAVRDEAVSMSKERGRDA